MAHDIPAVYMFVIQNTVCYFYVLYKIVYCFVPVQIMSVGYLFCTVDPTKVSAWENVNCVNRASMFVKKKKRKEMNWYLILSFVNFCQVWVYLSKLCV